MRSSTAPRLAALLSLLSLAALAALAASCGSSEPASPATDGGGTGGIGGTGGTGGIGGTPEAGPPLPPALCKAPTPPGPLPWFSEATEKFGLAPTETLTPQAVSVIAADLDGD
ncbi:MAG: hypothetical protein ABI193_07815, partial [Minicystis sp.]